MNVEIQIQEIENMLLELQELLEECQQQAMQQQRNHE
jgi:hypothetical protein